MDNIFAFGASILYGDWDREGGWVSRLRKFIDEKNLEDLDKPSCSVYNLGIPGDSSRDLLDRIDSDTKVRVDDDESNLFIISIGVNDSMFNNKNNANNISIESYKENLEEIIKKAEKYSDKIVFLGFSPIDEEKVDPIPWKPECSYKSEYIEEYNQVMKSVAEENKIYFIDVYDKISKLDYKNLLEDGIHPNSEGHKLIFEDVKDFLVENKLI